MTAEELHASRVLWAVLNALQPGQSLVLGRETASKVEVAIIGLQQEEQRPVRLRLKAATWEQLARRMALQMSVEFVQEEGRKK